jgi:hypothetical protein
MTEPPISFRNLLAPIAPDDFFARIYGREPLHIPGPPDKFAGLFGWDAFNGLINKTTLWSDNTMKLVQGGRNLTADEYCKPGRNRDGAQVMRPDFEVVSQLMEQGATVILDLVDRLDPGLAAVATALGVATGTRTSCNVYCSFAQKPAFNSHFDTMDVFALQIEGTKTWNVYEGRFEHPVNALGYEYSSFGQDHHDQAKGNVLHQVEMTPGDLLYVPRGQYHDALADSDASLHASFGLTRATGLDFIATTLRSLSDVAAFREALPGFDDEAAHQTHIQRLADELHEIISDPEIARQMRDDQRQRAFSELSALALPAADAEVHFRVLAIGANVDARGKLKTAAGSRDLAEKEAALARWALERDLFSWRAMAAAFPGLDPEQLGELIGVLAEAGLIEPI